MTKECACGREKVLLKDPVCRLCYRKAMDRLNSSAVYKRYMGTYRERLRSLVSVAEGYMSRRWTKRNST